VAWCLLESKETTLCAEISFASHLNALKTFLHEKIFLAIAIISCPFIMDGGNFSDANVEPVV
jgi:hypothetical protein